MKFETEFAISTDANIRYLAIAKLKISSSEAIILNSNHKLSHLIHSFGPGN